MRYFGTTSWKRLTAAMSAGVILGSGRIRYGFIGDGSEAESFK